MKSNFDRCLALTLAHEGGWADDPRDAGGATMKGITFATYRSWKGRNITKAELRAISDAEVAGIYRKNYWDAVRGDDLPAGLDLVAFDAAVNSGVSRGARWIQQPLGVSADGRVGPATIAAANAANVPVVIRAALANCLSFMKSAKNTKTGDSLWPTYKNGWTARVNAVESAALSMASNRTVTAPSVVPSPVPSGGIMALIVSFINGIFGNRG